MASYCLQSPPPFVFMCPDKWPKWKHCFQQLRLPSGLNTEGNAKQVSIHLYCMEEDAEDTLSSMKPTEDKHTDYDQVLEKFDTFFKVRKNLIFERAHFNKCSQQDDESVEQFITGLYSLADNCDFEDLTKL